MQNILLLHGALQDESDLQPLANALGSLGITARTFGFSGHGKKNFSNGFGIEQFSSELQDFIVKEKLPACNIFGYSMGGYVPLHLACNKPGLIRSITTLAVKFEWTSEMIAREASLCDPATIEAKAPAFAESLKNKHSDWKLLLRKTAEMIKNFQNAELLTYEKLASLDLRLMLGVGDQDKLVTIDETRKKMAAVPKAKMFVLPGTKHPLETAPTGILALMIAGFVE
jgi:pimeloyl-ACP methyl ester carboxylesterase